MIDILGAGHRELTCADGCTTHHAGLPDPFPSLGLEALQFHQLAPRGQTHIDVPGGAMRLTVVLDGMLSWSDTLGRGDSALGGEVLLLDAAEPVRQTLHNRSDTDVVEVVTLHGTGVRKNRCTQRYFSNDARRNHLCAVLSSDAGGDALPVDWPLTVFVASLTAGGSVVIPTPTGHCGAICAMSGAVTVEGQAVEPGGLALVTSEVPDLRVACDAPAEVLVVMAGLTRE